MVLGEHWTDNTTHVWALNFLKQGGRRIDGALTYGDQVCAMSLQHVCRYRTIMGDIASRGACVLLVALLGRVKII